MATVKNFTSEQKETMLLDLVWKFGTSPNYNNRKVVNCAFELAKMREVTNAK